MRAPMASGLVDLQEIAAQFGIDGSFQVRVGRRSYRVAPKIGPTRGRQ
jgi:hypothetical protein